MAFEPQKLYIGLVEFFSIWLPGGLLTYLVKTCWPDLLGSDVKSLKSPVAWVVLLFSSYLLGHFLFLIGSWLDDWVYDPIRNCTDNGQIKRLANGRKLSPRLFRWWAWVCFKKHPDAAVNRVVAVKDDYLKRIDAKDTVLAFQWCKARLSIRHPHALAIVNRFEADSKFFRSFLPLLAFFLVGAPFYHKWWWSIGSIGLLLLAFWRYMEQRFKSTQQAYWTILTIEAGKKRAPVEIFPSASCRSQDGSSTRTHAGGVVFREESGVWKCLLVKAKDDPNHLVLPKGHIESGEEAPNCAVREVREETGVWARVLNELICIRYQVKGTTIRVRFYLMEPQEEGKSDEPWRDPQWLSLTEAVEASHPESAVVLTAAADSWKRLRECKLASPLRPRPPSSTAQA